MKDSKPLIKSATFWVNFLAALALWVTDYFTSFEIIKNPMVSTTIMSVVNIVLRWFKTKSSINGIV